MKNFVVKRRSSFFVVFSIIFWLLACFAVVMLIVFNLIHKVNHDKKWSDYDDCGIF